MSCADFEARLNALADGELAAGERGAVDAHLADCAGCRATLEAIREQHRGLDAAFGPERRAAAALADRVVRAHRRPPRRRLLLTSSAAAAAALLVAFAVVRERQVAELRERLAQSESSCRALERQFRAQQSEPKKPAATLAVATGAVECRSTPEGDWEALGPGRGLEEGAWVRTADRAKCSFDCSDGTELRLNGATEIRLEKPRTVRLSRGEIYTRVAKDPSPYTVTTDQARIEALGTSLNIVHRPAQSTVLTVVEGNARMGGVAVPAGVQAVASGYLCRVVEGQVQPPVAAYELALLTKWVNEIVALKGGKDSPELQVRVNQLLAQIGRTKMEHLIEAEIRALGDHAALPLTRYIQSPESLADGRRRRDAARILADIASSPSVPDFVALLADGDAQVRAQAARGLQRLTGETLGFEGPYWTGSDTARGAVAWGAWLKSNEGTWSPPRDPKK